MSGEWNLKDLLQGFDVVGDLVDCRVVGLSLDSRVLRPGEVFLACAGSATHGLNFTREAVQRGAAAVVYEVIPGGTEDDFLDRWREQAGSLPFVGVEDLRLRVGEIAARFHGNPTHELGVIGITGTNGKSSCCYYIAQALHSDEEPCGVVGTLGYGRVGALRVGGHTTPDAVTLQALFAELLVAGVRRVVMEVSSHALSQGRVNGVEFDVAIFTNLTHDHLDYHGDIENYARAKRQLFFTPRLRAAVINGDDDYGSKLLASLPERVEAVCFSVARGCDEVDVRRVVKGEVTRVDRSGLDMRIDSPWGSATLRTELLGRFNASNLLASFAALCQLDVPFAVAMERLAEVRSVPGRMEHFGGDARRPLVVVDYAHTPDALQQVLQTLRELCAHDLWCVFGCGGDRDRQKRSKMGAIAERIADHVIVTDDNPRHEDPQTIIAQILSGLERPERATVISDRALAIRTAVSRAAVEDIVLVAGKGHEDYQQVGDRRVPFSDRAHVSTLLQEVA